MYVRMNGQVQQQLEEVNRAPAAPSVGRAMVLRNVTYLHQHDWAQLK